MEQLPRYLTDERTGLQYELCGDYYIIAGEDDVNVNQSEYGVNGI